MLIPRHQHDPRHSAAWIREINRAPVASLGDAFRAAKELRRKYRNDPLFEEFDRIIKDWICNPDRCLALKLEARAFLETGQGNEECRRLLSALVHADPEAPELYRGAGEPESVWVALQRFPLGESLDLPLASFTSDRKRAEEFAWLRVEEGAATEVLFTLRAGSRAVKIEVLAPDAIHWREREWYTGGRFVVEAARVVAGERIEVTLEQDAVYDVD